MRWQWNGMGGYIQRSPKRRQGYKSMRNIKPHLTKLSVGFVLVGIVVFNIAQANGFSPFHLVQAPAGMLPAPASVASMPKGLPPSKVSGTRPQAEANPPVAVPPTPDWAPTSQPPSGNMPASEPTPVGEKVAPPITTPMVPPTPTGVVASPAPISTPLPPSVRAVNKVYLPLALR